MADEPYDLSGKPINMNWLAKAAQHEADENDRADFNRVVAVYRLMAEVAAAPGASRNTYSDWLAEYERILPEYKSEWTAAIAAAENIGKDRSTAKRHLKRLRGKTKKN